jgi:hypothetical protein
MMAYPSDWGDKARQEQGRLDLFLSAADSGVFAGSTTADGETRTPQYQASSPT